MAGEDAEQHAVLVPVVPGAGRGGRGGDGDAAAAAEMATLRAQYSERMDVLDFTAARKQQLLGRMFFANMSVTSAPASFLQGVLTQWVSPGNVIDTLGSEGAAASFVRFDCLYTWCAWPTAGQSGPLRPANACEALPSATNSYLLVQLSDACSLDVLLTNAQNANAAGVVVAARPGEALFQMGSLSTAGQFGLVATLISHDAGSQLLELLETQTVTVTFQTNNINVGTIIALLGA